MTRLLTFLAATMICLAASAQTSREPVNPNATPEAKALLARLYKTGDEGKIICGLHHNQLQMPNYVYDLDRIEKAS